MFSDVWTAASVLTQLEGINKQVHVNIAEEMKQLGFERDFKQCRNKIKWLKHDYKHAVLLRISSPALNI